MKREKHFYTAQEVLQIIDKAHAKGITTIKIPGFEAEWGITTRPAAFREPEPTTSTPTDKPRATGVAKIPPKKCLDCNRDLKEKGKVGKLCVVCYRLRESSINEKPQAALCACGAELPLNRWGQPMPDCRDCWLRKREEESDSERQ